MRNKKKGNTMKKLTFITMLVAIAFLAACDIIDDPQITKIKTSIIQKNKDNYQTVNRAEITINSTEPVEIEPLTQNFKGSVVIRYYDKDNHLITKEYTDTIQEAINQSKFGQTLVRNNGTGMRIEYTVKYEGNFFYKGYSKDKSITVPRKVNIKKVDATEQSLKIAIYDSKNDTFKWTGNTNTQVDSITINEDRSHGGVIGNVIDDLSSIAIGSEHKHVRKYKYEDNKLTLISEYDK